jgi:flagellar M-ring protein FliF
MNKSFSQLGQQLLGIWKQLGVNQRISVVVSTLGVLAGLIALAFWSSKADYSLLYGKLEEGEAAKIVAVLDESKVPYQVRGGGSIWVPSDKVYSLRMQMAGKGIPRGEGVGFEIFDKANFGISDFVQHANYIRAVQGELSRTIAQLDQIESARVMIVMPENRLLMDAQRKPTASVFVHTRGGALPASSVNSIRFLVANSVEGLQVNNVSVVDNQGNVLSSNEEPDSAAGMSNSQLAARRNLEQYLTKNVETMLNQVLGPGQSVVRVAAEINLDSLTRKEEKFDPDGQVVSMSQVDDEDTQSTNPTPGGAPGVASNSATDTGSNAPTSAVALNNSRTKKKTTTNKYEITKTTSDMVQAAGGIKHLSSAVFIATRFEGTNAASRKPAPRTAEEIEKIRRIVQSALGVQPSGETNSEVTVEEMPFNDQVAQDLTTQFEKQRKWQMWMDLAPKLIYAGLGIGVIFMFWRLFQRTPSDEIRLGPMITNGNGHGVKGLPGGRSVVTVEVLNQLIRENPTNMTQAVRSWLTRGQSEN